MTDKTPPVKFDRHSVDQNMDSQEAGRLPGSIELNVQVIVDLCDQIRSKAKQALADAPDMDKRKRALYAAAIQMSGFLRADAESWYQRARIDLERLAFKALIQQSECATELDILPGQEGNGLPVC